MLLMILFMMAISSAYTCNKGNNHNNLFLLDDKYHYHDLACSEKNLTLNFIFDNHKQEPFLGMFIMKVGVSGH